MSRIVLAIALAAVALGSTAPAFAANNGPNCSAKSAAEFGKCTFLQASSQQN